MRDARGAVRPAAAIDGEVERTVALAAAKGARCLLRVLDSSKTGAGAPSIAAVDHLCEKYGDTVTVLVDACQMRCDRAAIRAYAGRGWLVQVTGSKFFGGVPFAGALLVPRLETGATRSCAPVAEGLADYAGSFEWPETWPSARAALPQACNVGLLLRWTSALESAGRLATVDQEDWLACARNLERRLSHVIEGSPGLSLLHTPVFDRTDLGMPDRWSDLPTILAFTIEDPATGAPLDLQALKQVHRLLMKDLSDRICAAGRSHNRDVMARPCHLGQPVQVNGGNAGNRAVLRLCISARTIAEAMGEGRCDERIGAIVEHAGIALQKLRLIVDNLADLNGGCAN